MTGSSIGLVRHVVHVCLFVLRCLSVASRLYAMLLNALPSSHSIHTGLFAKFDADNSKTLELDELIDGLAQFTSWDGQTPSIAEIEVAFKYRWRDVACRFGMMSCAAPSRFTSPCGQVP